jgi:hypothetical protein
MDVTNIVEEIHLVLAPGVMISSSALLLLGFQTKFSNLASRFRALNQELRELKKNLRKESWQTERFESLTRQVSHLLARATHVKNAILLTYAAVLFFLMTSVLIFLNVHGAGAFSSWIQASFVLGLLLQFGAVLTLMIEAALAFKIIKIEAGS